MRNSIPPERREEFARDWEGGVLRVAEMAAKYGCSHSTLTAAAKRLGLPLRQAGRKPVDDGLTGGEWRPGRCGVLYWRATA